MWSQEAAQFVLALGIGIATALRGWWGVRRRRKARQEMDEIDAADLGDRDSVYAAWRALITRKRRK